MACRRGLKAFSFDGSEFTLLAQADTVSAADYVHGDGTYIYVAHGSHGLEAFSYSADGCTDPAGAAGEMIYNSGHDTMQYCNGAEWAEVGK